MIEMLALYHLYSKADKYIIGFIYDNKVYYIIQDDIGIRNVRVNKTSAGVKCLRLYITESVKMDYIQNAIYLCTFKHLCKVNQQINNFGYSFEKIIFSKYGKKWKRDNIAFYKAGDMQYKGIQYQIKFHGATLTNMNTLQGLISREII